VTADASGGRVWEASKIDGTLSNTGPDVAGCSAAVSIDWTFKNT